MPAEGSRSESRPITSLRFLQPQPSASTSASEGKETTPRHQRHQTSEAAASKHSPGTISNGFAGAEGLPKQARVEPATPTMGNRPLMKPMSALFAPVQQGTNSATTKTSVDPRSGNEIARNPVFPTNRPAPRRPKRLLASENEVEQWEREADRVDELRRAKTPRTKGDGNDETAVAAVPIEDDGMAIAGETKTKQEPLPRQEPAANLRPITFFHPHSRPANNRAAADTTTTTKIVPPARKPDKSPAAAAVYDLSSLAPIVSRRPKIEAADSHPQQKPKLPPDPGAPRPVALSKLTSAVFVPVDETKKQKKKKQEPAQAALSAFRPLPLSLEASSMAGNGLDDAQEGQEVEVEEWSPKKRKGGYLVSGMAARASSLLSAARTEQTLWLHDFSRRLAQLSSGSSFTAPTSNGRTTTLAAELRPDLRLRVLQVLSFGNDEADSFVTSDRRRERRTTLAVCRLLERDRDRDCQAADPVSSPSKGEPSTRETQGLVLFSLHDHQLSSGGAGGASGAVPLPSPTKRPRPDSDPSSSSSSTARTLAVPTIPPDLRLIRPGAEVWVWEPFHEVTLLGAGDVRFDDQTAPSSSSALLSGQRGTPGVPVGDVSVQWRDGGTAADREAALSIDGGSEAVAKKGLVCGRFAILT